MLIIPASSDLPGAVQWSRLLRVRTVSVLPGLQRRRVRVAPTRVSGGPLQQQRTVPQGAVSLQRWIHRGVL